jgi:hypothetical protein
MANLFFNLPVPAGNGAGAGVDVSQLGQTRTITVGGSFLGTVHVEGSAEGVGGPWAPITSFATVADEFIVNIAAPFMRVRRSGVPGVGAPGLPNVDVAGNDNGCLFADLPPPPVNGIGASVDVSNLGTFKTVYCLGTWAGTVNIEFSEDGVGWSQITSFTNPGQRSKPFTAKFMRASRSGVPPTGAPGLPNVDVAAANDPLAIPGGGDGVCCHLIYQSEGPHTGPSVFNDWNALYAQLLAFRAAANGSGFYHLGYDDEFVTPVVVPAGAYDMAGVTHVPYRDPTNGSYVDVDLDEGVVLTNSYAWAGRVRFNSLGDVAAPISIADDEVYTIRDGAIVQASGAIAFFDGAGLDEGDIVTFVLDDIAQLGNGENAVIADPASGSIIVLSLGSQAEVLANALDLNINAELRVVWRNSSAFINGTQPAMLATVFTQTDLVLDRWRIRFEDDAAVAAVLGDHIGSTPPIGGQIVTLPLETPYSSGQQVCVKREAAANALVVVPTGPQTIEGLPFLGLIGLQSVILTWDGVSNWRATAGYADASAGGTGTIISFANDNIGGGAFTRYISPWNGGNSSVAASGAAGLAELQYPLARGGTLRNLIVRHDAGPIPPPPSVLITYTLLVNGVATALTVTLAATAGAQAIDLVNSVVVVQGDLVALEAVKTGVVAPPLIFVRAGVELV